MLGEPLKPVVYGQNRRGTGRCGQKLSCIRTKMPDRAAAVQFGRLRSFQMLQRGPMLAVCGRFGRICIWEVQISANLAVPRRFGPQTMAAVGLADAQGPGAARAAADGCRRTSHERRHGRRWADFPSRTRTRWCRRSATSSSTTHQPTRPRMSSAVIWPANRSPSSITPLNRAALRAARATTFCSIVSAETSR